MYTLKINDTMNFSIDVFNESFNTYAHKAILMASAENDANKDMKLTSLSYLADALSSDEALNMQIVDDEEVVLWESDRYVLDDAQLILQKRSEYVDGEYVDKNVVVSSLSFSFAPVIEPEVEEKETDDSTVQEPVVEEQGEEPIEAEPIPEAPSESAPMPEEELKEEENM